MLNGEKRGASPLKQGFPLSLPLIQYGTLSLTYSNKTGEANKMDTIGNEIKIILVSR